MPGRTLPFKYVRLQDPREGFELPYHERLGNKRISPNKNESLETFCNEIVEEAKQLIITDLYDKRLFTQSDGDKWAPRVKSKTMVESLLGGGLCRVNENLGATVPLWYARRSEHVDEDISWANLRDYLGQNRLMHEFHWQPDVYDCQLICEWPVAKPAKKVPEGDSAQVLKDRTDSAQQAPEPDLITATQETPTLPPDYTMQSEYMFLGFMKTSC